MYLDESTVEKMREQLAHRDEIMTDALRKRDAHRLMAQEYRDQLGQARVQISQLEAQMQSQAAQLDQLRTDNRDLEAFNRMLQKMIRRMAHKDK